MKRTEKLYVSLNDGERFYIFHVRVKLSDHTFQTVVPQLALHTWADS